MENGAGEFDHLTTADVLAIHEVIVESSPDTEPGISSTGDVEFVIETVRDGHFGRGPKTIHEKAYQLLRLLVANHPFVDGNKRTALASVVTFYALNGYQLAYDRDLKAVLKRLATDEATVDEAEVVEYLADRTESLPPEYEATYQLWRDLFGSQRDHSDDTNGRADPNGYSDGDPTNE